MKTDSRRIIRIGNRAWGHRSVLALVEEHGHPIDPVGLIRSRARQLVARARKRGWDGPPFDPRQLASLLGIRVHANELEDNHDACIFPRGEQLEIIFNPTRPHTRQNFSICHEIAHTLFPDSYEMIRNRYQRRAKFDPDRELETLCDIGAAEILLPEEEFTSDLARLGHSLEAVQPLRERYQASREAVIRRMVQFDKTVSAAVFIENRIKPSEGGVSRQSELFGKPRSPEPKLRIAYSVASQGFRVFLPEHKSLPEDSCVYAAMASEGVHQAVENWDIQGLPTCHVEAMSMPSGDDPGAPARVVALIRHR